MNLHLSSRHHLRRVKGHAKGVHSTESSLLGREAVVGPIDGGSNGSISVDVDRPLGYVSNLIALVILWENIGRMSLRKKMGDIEGCSRSGRVRNGQGG